VMKIIKTLWKVMLILSIIFDIVCVFLFFPEFRNIKSLFGVFLAIIIFLIYFIGKYSLIIGIYISVKLGKSKAYREKLSEIDFKNNNEYFRDIIQDYNPVELSYIDDFKLNNLSDVIALLMMLNKKGIIKFNEEKKIIELTNQSLALSDVENYVLDNIYFGKLRFKEENLTKLKYLAMQSAFDKGLIKKDDNKIQVFKILALFIISPIISFALINLLPHFFSVSILGIILECIFTMVVCFIPFFEVYLIVYIIVYLVKKRENPFVRTEKGEEVNKRLEGLKNYLKDFSSLNEKNVEEIIIWNDYLIYSVLFEQNEKVINEIFNNYFEK